jgi:RHS repeat-associated protein
VDGNHNVTALVNSQGTLVARYIYDPYGNLLESWGSLADANLYRFASQEVHPQSGLYAYTFRFYDPNLGRWINRDPIGFLGGRNPFVFAGNNPINNADPYGLDFHLTGASGVLTPGPLGYLSGDTALEQMAAEGYNLVPEAGNIVANALAGLSQVFEGAVDLSKWLTQQLGGSPSDQELVGTGVALGSLVVGGPEARLGKVSCAAKSGTQLARELGAAGEEMSGIVSPKTRIPSLTGTANYRVPDQLIDNVLLRDAKNVGELRVTPQLIDFGQYSQQYNLRFILDVRQNTVIGPSAQQFIDQYGVQINPIYPPR